jgi:hypothetical protein
MSSDQHAAALPTSVTGGRHSADGTDLHHHHDDDHAFDDTPASALPADEPRTPGWLPAVGLALLLAALVAVLASGDEAPRSAVPVSEPAPAAAEAAAERPANPPTAVRAPTGIASAIAQPRPPRTPEQRKELQKRIEDARARQVVPPPAQPAPAP